MMRIPSSLAALLLLAAACGGRPDGTTTATGSLSGHVYMSGPVSGVTVTAFALDLETGDLGDALAESEPTGADGAYLIDLGPYSGPMMLVARGASAAYTEPASGAQAQWEQSTVLRSVPVAWNDSRTELRFGVEHASDQDVQINPFTELAVERAEVAAREFFQPYPEALDVTYRAFADHLELDFWKVVPRSLVDERQAAAWNEQAQAGLLVTGLSMLARRIAVASSVAPSSLSTVALLDGLRRDINDDAAVFDGAGNTGIIELGNCEETAYCTFSGRTFRGDWAESMALFLFDDTLNASGFSFGDVADLVNRISWRQGILFAGPGGDPDGSPPRITVTGLQDADILTGEQSFSIEVRDAFELDTAELLRFERGAEQAWVEGTASLLSVDRQEAPTLHQLDVTVDSAALNDGPIDLVVRAADKAGNEAELRWTVFFENTPAGSLAGTVTIGGRLDGAEVNVYDYTGCTQGALLGTTTTDSSGFYLVEVAESPDTEVLLVVAGKPANDPASYVETSSGATVQLSTDDVVEAVLEDWTDGDNRTLQITPWTHIAAAFARGLWGTRYFAEPNLCDEAAADAYSLLEEHFNDGNFVSLRAVVPAVMTEASQTQTLNAQVRYGLVIAGLGELADEHAAQSQAGPASMNTLTLTQALARDLEGAVSGEPLFDGHTGGGTLDHGLVPGSSYWTRVDLAIAIVTFIETNPRDTSTLVENDILSLLDQISLDDNSRLYPAGEPPIAYDLDPPGPLAFTAPTPAESTVLKGAISLRATAMDNRRLITFEWLGPAGITGTQLDTTAGFTGPWVLTGSLDLSAFADGPIEIQARATDEALRSSTVTRTVILDTTPPTVAIGSANDGGGALADGDWTGASSLVSVTGTASDENGLTAVDYRWNGGSWTAVSRSGSSWSIGSLLLANGANTLEVRAIDPAANARTVSATFNRDATPPVVETTPSGNSALLQTEEQYTVSISGVAPGTISYDTTLAPDPVRMVNTISFTKWAARYIPGAPNLPEWRWQVSDNRTPAASIATEYRLRRGGTTLVNWTALGGGSGTGYNRSLVLSSGIHAQLNQVSGTCQLDVRATDEFGNVSGVTTVSWTQTIKNPAARIAVPNAQNAIPNCDNRGVWYYDLGNQRPCPSSPANNFANVINGSIPGGKLRVRAWRIDNPNPIPIRVQISTYLTSRSRTSRLTGTPDTGDAVPAVWPNTNCAPNGYGDSLQDGSCYTLIDPGTTETLPTGELILLGMTHDLWTTTMDRNVGHPPCAGCAANEREIPANSSILAFALVDDLSFLDPSFAAEYQNVPAIGSQPPVAGVWDATFRHCDTQSFINGNWVCTSFSMRAAVRHITRLKLLWGGSSTIYTRSGAAASFELAPGTPTSQGYSQTVDTTETGYSTNW